MAKKRKKKSIKGSAQSAAALNRNGLKAFQAEDYGKAIEIWERVRSPYRATQALAEAYFRRGVERFYDSDSGRQEGWKDLQKAAELQPQDPGYTYHLGLAAHHLDDLDRAVKAYRKARQTQGPYAARAAYPLALALSQQGEAPGAYPVWADLSSAEQVMLQEVDAFQRRPYQLSSNAPKLWHALAALDAGDLSTAQAGLKDHSPANKTEQGILHYYQGVLFAQKENWESARREWRAACETGLRNQRLQHNLGELFHRAAEDLLVSDDPKTALAAAQETGRYKPDDSALKGILTQCQHHLGYQAALAGQWDRAQNHWETAVEMGGGSFRLAYNLALIHERKENYLAAAETWREALRRRPRRDDHPEAISDDQVARLWQHTAEAYRKAGEYEEANQVHQQAIKWSPDNLNVRLAMVQGLLMEGRERAAQNELERILEQDPDHVPSLLLMGEILFNSDKYWIRSGALYHWKQALKLEPDNPLVRQAMAEWYHEQAEIDYSWDRFEEAVENYQKALEYQPREPRILAFIAECLIYLEDFEQAEQYSQKAFERAGDSLNVLSVILRGWIRTDNPERAWEIMKQFEARNKSIPTPFYLDHARLWLEEEDLENAIPWLERAESKADPDENILYYIGMMLFEYKEKMARQYLEKAIEAEQLPGRAHLSLHTLENSQGNIKEGKKHLIEAERIARRTRDRQLADMVQMAWMILEDPEAFMGLLMEIGDPDLMAAFLHMTDGDFDEDEFYGY